MSLVTWTTPILWGMNMPTPAMGIYISEGMSLIYLKAAYAFTPYKSNPPKACSCLLV